MEADFVEAATEGTVVGEGVFHSPPEVGRVVHYGEVGEFVDYDIVDDVLVGHDQTPVEADASVGGAASPPPALAAHQDF